MKKKMVLVHPLPEVRQQLPGPRETLWLRNALARCLAWQPARRCVYRVRPLQAHGDCLEQIQEAYGYGEITSDRRDKLTDLWEAREAAQRKGKKDGKYHDLVTDMLARAIHSVGNEYAEEIAAYEEERRMRRSYYEKVENRANGGASDDEEESDH